MVDVQAVRKLLKNGAAISINNAEERSLLFKLSESTGRYDIIDCMHHDDLLSRKNVEHVAIVENNENLRFRRWRPR